MVTVMLHAGVCVPRQYARFAGTAYGHNVTKFFDKLVQRGYATASDCLHNLLFLRRAAGMMSAFENAAREELTGRFSPDTIAEFRWYCKERRDTSDVRARCQTDERFWQAHRAFTTQRCQMLYRRWLTDGDTVFELVSSTALANALARGTARIESHVLLASYDHLSPLVSLVRSSAKGVEEGATASTQPQPPPPPPLSISDQLTRELVSPRWPLMMRLRTKHLRLVTPRRWGGVFCRP